MTDEDRGLTCGDFGGTTEDGDPCQRDAGAGTEGNEGPCWDHDDVEFQWKPYEEPWLRLPGETGKAFEAFRLYRDLGPARTKMEAYRQYSGREEAKAPLPGYFAAWARTYAWNERAREYDNHRDRQAQEQLREARRDALDQLRQALPTAVNQLIRMIVGFRRVQQEQMEEQDREIGPTNHLRAIENILDRLGLRVPEEVMMEHEAGDGLQTWIDMLEGMDEEAENGRPELEVMEGGDPPGGPAGT